MYRLATVFGLTSAQPTPQGLSGAPDNTDATDFIFSRILFLLVLPLDIGFTTDCFCAYTALDSLQQEIIRDNHCAQQAPKIQQHTIKIRERTDPSHRLSVIDFEHGERDKGE